MNIEKKVTTKISETVKNRVALRLRIIYCMNLVIYHGSQLLH